MNRTQVISDITDLIAGIYLDHPVRVGIDGVDVSGKTMLADELIEPLQSRSRTVIRVSVDGFHNPKAIRYRQGRGSPKGYYEDSFNHDAIVAYVLHPLGPGGDRKYRPSFYDFRTDRETDVSWQHATPDSVLIFEGIFLHRAELRSHWDFSIFVHADFDVTIKRAQKRDLHLFETPEKIREIYLQRYIPGAQIYLNAERPFEKATVLLHNNDIHNPRLEINNLANTTVEPTS
jgi:uridine kinase